MKKTLITAATKKEVAPLIDYFNCDAEFSDNQYCLNPNLYLLITGVGIVSTAFVLGDFFAKHHFDMVLNVGIAGSFKNEIKNGTVVSVKQDCFADFGAENENGFIPFSISDGNDFVVSDFPTNFYATASPNYLDTILSVSAITVNLVHGKRESIENISAFLNPDIETMEGAACFYVCKKANIPVAQLRVISNFIEPRNKDNWRVSEAITILNQFLINAFKDNE